MKPILFVLALLVIPISVCGQNTGVGLPPFGSYTNTAFDTIVNSG